jgi:phosphatidylethanolamine-binding protein (PEBP) family uncharacterized protein
MTKSAVTASARISLALALAALALAGCGGGSSGDSSSASSSSTASGAASTPSPQSDASAAGSGGTSGGADSRTPSAKDVTGGGSSPAGSGGQQSPSGAKQGSSVPQPVGAPEPGITPEQRREATVASITLQSPSSQASGGGPPALSAEYTCDGKNTSPALSWQGVPEGTAELVLFTMNTQPVAGKLFFDWAVAGLSPDLEEIAAGKLPKGAVVGRNSFGKNGYEICPEGSAESYVFLLFALPKKLSPDQGFEPLALRKSVSEISSNAGLMALSYTRG